MKKIFLRLISFILFIAMLLSVSALSGCKNDSEPASAETELDTSETEPTETGDSTETDVAPSDDTTAADTDKAETAPVTETEAVTEEPEIPSTDPEKMNPLTGLATKYDYRLYRPVAIMINNVRIACPQMGVSKADIMYECLVEGGYTRLMMLVSDYGSLPVVGSVRSSRDYYLDFAANHDAIYFHAGGSPQAYSEIKARSINNVDGVNMYTPSTFYRDAVRMKTMGYEHSVMTTGSGVVSALLYLKYKTRAVATFESPMKFLSDTDTITYTGDAPHVHIPYSGAQIADFVYDKDRDVYLRYQFNGVKHIDGATDEQLWFKSIIMIFNPTAAVPGDSSGRIAVTTTGTGDGYYVSEGKYIPIKWSKETRDTPIQFTNTDGTQLKINRGKTFISIISNSVKNSVSFNYKW